MLKAFGVACVVFEDRAAESTSYDIWLESSMCSLAVCCPRNDLCVCIMTGTVLYFVNINVREPPQHGVQMHKSVMISCTAHHTLLDVASYSPDPESSAPADLI